MSNKFPPAKPVFGVSRLHYPNITIIAKSQPKADVVAAKIQSSTNTVAAKIQSNTNTVAVKIQSNTNTVAAKIQSNTNTVAAKIQSSTNTVAAKIQSNTNTVAAKIQSNTNTASAKVQLNPTTSTSNASQAMARFIFSPQKKMNKPAEQTAIIEEEDKKPFVVESPAVGNVEIKMTRRRSSKKIKKLKDPLAPKRAPSSFLLFCKEERPKVVQMLGSKHVGPVAVELAKRWAELDPEVKTKWDAKGKEMKAEYFKVKEKYKPSEEFLSAAAVHDEKQQIKKAKGGSAKTGDKMASYFTHLLTNWVKVATIKPELTPQEVQQLIWKHWSSKSGQGLGGKRRKKKAKDPNAPKHPMSAYLIYLNQMRADLIKENPNMSNSEVMAEAGRKWKSLDEEVRAPFVEEAKKKSEEYYQEMAKYRATSDL